MDCNAETACYTVHNARAAKARNFASEQHRGSCGSEPCGGPPSSAVAAAGRAGHLKRIKRIDNDDFINLFPSQSAASGRVAARCRVADRAGSSNGAGDSLYNCKQTVAFDRITVPLQSAYQKSCYITERLRSLANELCLICDGYRPCMALQKSPAIWFTVIF